MIHLEKALSAWGKPDFNAVLKHEIAQLDAGHLPMQQGLTTGNYVADVPITVAINNVTELDDVIRVKAGIFFQSVIGGCGCADDPTPVSEINEYCEVQLDINKTTSETLIAILG